jgi:2-iminoacetate synthase ThiH
LLAGADDYGGTLFEENISRLAGSTAGQYTSAAEFQERILDLGRVPAQRNTLYTQYTYPAAGSAGSSGEKTQVA